MLKSMDKIKSSISDRIGCQCRWKGTIVGKEFDGFGNALGTRFWHIGAMAAVVLGSSAKVPSVDAMWRPGTADARVFIDKNLGAGWSKWRAVVIERAIELRLCRQLWVDA